MNNPFQQSPPDDATQRIHALARDLAYGALYGDWGTQLTFDEDHNWKDDPRLRDAGEFTYNQHKFRVKWPLHFAPSLKLLISFSYLEREGESGVKGTSLPLETDYVLTPKAFALLEKPSTPPSVFISYKQDQSSALALLIEARLKLKDSNIHVFIDKLLEPGDQWEQRLEENVRQSREFICLIGPETLKSETVLKEINWAIETGCRIIPICHSGYKPDKSPPQIFHNNQAIIINPESAEEYELAMIKLLNSLGYSTV